MHLSCDRLSPETTRRRAPGWLRGYLDTSTACGVVFHNLS
jgi:hypothetical protein